MRLHHVQVACPPGGEDVARRFYAEGLGLTEVEKPADLRARGGAWFRAYDGAGAVTAEIHVGVEDPFVPARKAHPAFVVDSVAELEATVARLEAGGHEVDRSQRTTFAGYERFHTVDGHGNRVEVLAPSESRRDDVVRPARSGYPPVACGGMSQVLTMWEKVSRLPQGKRIFSILFAQKAPYFATIRPRFTEIRPNRAELVIPKRRGVHNHIGTVHAIALCNGLEAAMGALAEATVPADKRWIPKGMEVAYTAKATSDITCIAETDAEQWSGEALPDSGGDLPVRVRGVRDDGTVVVEGVIRLWVTPRK